MSTSFRMGVDIGSTTAKLALICDPRLKSVFFREYHKPIILELRVSIDFLALP